MTAFDRAIEFVLKHEGDYVDNPADPGGETNYGISKRAYPGLDIKNLTVETAKEIYRQDYWQAAGCEALEWPLSLIVMDTAVNCGVDKAIEWREKYLNWTDYLFARIEFYNRLKKPMFLPGWINRVIELWRMAKETEHPISGV